MKHEYIKNLKAIRNDDCTEFEKYYKDFILEPSKNYLMNFLDYIQEFKSYIHSDKSIERRKIITSLKDFSNKLKKENFSFYKSEIDRVVEILKHVLITQLDDWHSLNSGLCLVIEFLLSIIIFHFLGMNAYQKCPGLCEKLDHEKLSHFNYIFGDCHIDENLLCNEKLIDYWKRNSKGSYREADENYFHVILLKENSGKVNVFVQLAFYLLNIINITNYSNTTRSEYTNLLYLCVFIDSKSISDLFGHHFLPVLLYLFKYENEEGIIIKNIQIFEIIYNENKELFIDISTHLNEKIDQIYKTHSSLENEISEKNSSLDCKLIDNSDNTSKKVSDIVFNSCNDVPNKFDDNERQLENKNNFKLTSEKNYILFFNYLTSILINVNFSTDERKAKLNSIKVVHAVIKFLSHCWNKDFLFLFWVNLLDVATEIINATNERNQEEDDDLDNEILERLKYIFVALIIMNFKKLNSGYDKLYECFKSCMWSNMNNDSVVWDFFNCLMNIMTLYENACLINKIFFIYNELDNQSVQPVELFKAVSIEIDESFINSTLIKLNSIFDAVPRAKTGPNIVSFRVTLYLNYTELICQSGIIGAYCVFINSFIKIISFAFYNISEAVNSSSKLNMYRRSIETYLNSALHYSKNFTRFTKNYLQFAINTLHHKNIEIHQKQVISHYLQIFNKTSGVINEFLDIVLANEISLISFIGFSDFDLLCLDQIFSELSKLEIFESDELNQKFLEVSRILNKIQTNEYSYTINDKIELLNNDKFKMTLKSGNAVTISASNLIPSTLNINLNWIHEKLKLIIDQNMHNLNIEQLIYDSNNIDELCKIALVVYELLLHDKNCYGLKDSEINISSKNLSEELISEIKKTCIDIIHFVLDRKKISQEFVKYINDSLLLDLDSKKMTKVIEIIKECLSSCIDPNNNQIDRYLHKLVKLDCYNIKNLFKYQIFYSSIQQEVCENRMSLLFLIDSVVIDHQEFNQLSKKYQDTLFGNKSTNFIKTIYEYLPNSFDEYVRLLILCVNFELEINQFVNHHIIDKLFCILFVWINMIPISKNLPLIDSRFLTLEHNHSLISNQKDKINYIELSKTIQMSDILYEKRKELFKLFDCKQSVINLWQHNDWYGPLLYSEFYLNERFDPDELLTRIYRLIIDKKIKHQTDLLYINYICASLIEKCANNIYLEVILNEIKNLDLFDQSRCVRQMNYSVYIKLMKIKYSL